MLSLRMSMAPHGRLLSGAARRSIVQEYIAVNSQTPLRQYSLAQECMAESRGNRRLRHTRVNINTSNDELDSAFTSVFDPSQLLLLLTIQTQAL